MAGFSGLQDATWDSASSAEVRFGSSKFSLVKLSPSKVEIKTEKVARVGESLAGKRTPGRAEVSDPSGEMLATDWFTYVLPRMPQQGGTLIELVTLVTLSHPSVLGDGAILMDRCRFTAIEGPELDGSEKGLIVKFTMSAMAVYHKGADGQWKAYHRIEGLPSSTAVALMKF